MFTPENLREKALELCKRKVMSDIERKTTMLNDLKDIEDVVRFHEDEIDGFYTGYGKGYDRGTSDQPRYDED